MVGRQAPARPGVVDAGAQDDPAVVGEHVVDARAGGGAVPRVVGGGLRPALAELGERVVQAAGDQTRDCGISGRRVQVAHDQPRQRGVEPVEQGLRAAPPRGGRGAVPVGVRQAEPVAGQPVREPAEGDDARDRVAPGSRAGCVRRVREPADGPRVERQPSRAVDDRAALAAAVPVVAAGAGACVAGQPARQRALLQRADLLEADEVRLEAGDGGCARAGPQRPAVPAVAAQPGPHVEGGDAQDGEWPRPLAVLRVALRVPAHVGK